MLKMLLVVFSLLLIGCATAPLKPILEICQIDYPRSECICGMTTNETNLQNKQVITIQRYPLYYCDKATSIRPPEWEKLINYLHLLEQHVSSRCQ